MDYGDVLANARPGPRAGAGRRRHRRRVGRHRGLVRSDRRRRGPAGLGHRDHVAHRLRRRGPVHGRRHDRGWQPGRGGAGGPPAQRAPPAVRPGDRRRAAGGGPPAPAARRPRDGRRVGRVRARAERSASPRVGVLAHRRQPLRRLEHRHRTGHAAGRRRRRSPGYGLDAAFPAALIALLLPRLREPVGLRVGLLGAALAVAATFVLPPGVPVLLALVGLVAAGRAPLPARGSAS